MDFLDDFILSLIAMTAVLFLVGFIFNKVRGKSC